MSDQDFFFDEDEQPKKEAPKSGGSKKSSGSSRAAAPAPVAESGQGVSMTIMILVAVVALLVGMIIGIFVGRGLAASAVPAVGTGATIGGSSAPVAPQLTPEQLQGGQLPPGHPDLGAGKGSGAATGSTDATK